MLTCGFRGPDPLYNTQMGVLTAPRPLSDCRQRHALSPFGEAADGLDRRRRLRCSSQATRDALIAGDNDLRGDRRIGASNDVDGRPSTSRSLSEGQLLAMTLRLRPRRLGSPILDPDRVPCEPDNPSAMRSNSPAPGPLCRVGANPVRFVIGFREVECRHASRRPPQADAQVYFCLLKERILPPTAGFELNRPRSHWGTARFAS